MTPRLALIALQFLSSFSDNILCYQLQQIILGSNGKLYYDVHCKGLVMLYNRYTHGVEYREGIQIT